jgi:hypothetical protein
VLIGVVVLLFTGRYPRGIFDLVLGMNRWVLRVAAYAGLMTDRYPPFRLDMGEDEPGTMTLDPPAAAPPAAPAASSSGGRIALMAVGSIVALIAAAVFATGGAALVFDQTQRDDQGFLMTSAKTYSTGGYALVSEPVKADLDGPDWVPPGLLGTVKLRSESGAPVFVGIGPAAAVERYLGAPPPARLSRAALESLAVIAYRQPVTRAEVDFVRGVNSDSAIATLLARGLVAEVGRKETVGRPVLLATTPECLQYLGLRSLADLPPLEAPA